MKFFASTLCLLTLTLSTPALLNCQPATALALKGQTTREKPAVVIRALICAYALKYKVDPAIAMAVAHVESSTKDKEFRCGLIGRTYYGPFGLHKDFLKKWPIDNLEVNVEVGVKALRCQHLKRRLKKYNTQFTEAYWKAIVASTKRYRQTGVGG